MCCAILPLATASGAAAPYSPTAAAQATCTDGSFGQPPMRHLHYRMRLLVARSLHRVEGRQQLLFTPERPIRQVVFRLWPNAPAEGKGSHLRILAAWLGDDRVRFRLPNPTTMVVRLPQASRRGASIRIKLRWRLQIAAAADSRLGVRDHVLRLGSFFPIAPWDPRRGWLLDPPAQLRAEASSSPIADFAVSIAAPRRLTAIATGQRGRDGVWRARAVRDFAAAIGALTVTKRAARIEGRAVTVSAAVTTRRGISGDAFAARAADLLERLSDRFGAYPWHELTLVITPDLRRSGIEYPQLIFEGTAALDRVTPHEVAHQWFYSLVGNDQARDPWLDEALATWAGIEVAGALPWLEQQRVPPFAQHHLGASISYWNRHQPAYFAGIYLAGAKTLGSLGPPDLVNCALRAYVTARAWQIAQPADLVTILEQRFDDARKILRAAGLESVG